MVVAATATWTGYKAYELVNDWRNTRSHDTVEEASETKEKEDKEKQPNRNPFEGPVDEGVIAVDPQGNAIPVAEGNWLTSSPDGVWIQEMQPGIKPDGEPTGTRKDGGGHAKEKDVRAKEPHAHVPDVTNSDGTPWLPINE